MTTIDKAALRKLAEDRADMRKRADAWLSDHVSGRRITRDNAINEENLALDVVELLDAIETTEAEIERMRPVFNFVVVQNLGSYRVRSSLSHLDRDLFDRLGLLVDAAVAVHVPRIDDESRCAVCQWPLAETAEKGCVRGNCSMRPLPTNYYAPERAERERKCRR